MGLGTVRDALTLARPCLPQRWLSQETSPSRPQLQCGRRRKPDELFQFIGANARLSIFPSQCPSQVPQGRRNKVGWARVVRDARGNHGRGVRGRAPARNHCGLRVERPDICCTCALGVLHDCRGRHADIHGMVEDEGARGEALQLLPASQGKGLSTNLFFVRVGKRKCSQGQPLPPWYRRSFIMRSKMVSRSASYMPRACQ